MRVPQFALGMLSIAWTGLLSGEALRITTTPSHTPTHTHTPTMTPTPTATFGPTVVATPKPTPWPIGGAEFQINELTTSGQNTPALATGEDDGFVAVWMGSDGSGQGIVGRLFDKTGAPVAGDFQVNSTTTGNQYKPSIASDGAGNFVVVWTSQPGDFDPPDILGRRFAANGSPLGDDFVVNTYTTGEQKEADVAMDPQGNFNVVWNSTAAVPEDGQDGDSSGIFGQRFDPAGDPVGNEFLVNTTTTGNQFSPTVATDGARFFTAWAADSETGGFEIRGQMFENDGSPVGLEQLVSGSTGSHVSPDVDAILGAGQFVVAYLDYQGSGPWNVFGRLYGFDGSSLGDPFRINTETAQSHFAPRVSASKSGFQEKSFVVVWETVGVDDPGQLFTGIAAQRFSNQPFGTAAFSLVAPPRAGSEYQINTFVTGDQRWPAAASDDRGQFVIAWSSYQGGDYTGIFARRFGFPDAAAARVVDDAPGNQNGVLDPGETVVYDTAWRNAGGNTGTLQGTLANLTGPDGPSYTIDDATALYGQMSAGDTHDCLSQGGDCYEVTISGQRPAQHWDATADETLTSSVGPLLGQPLPRVKTWPVHVGGSFADEPDTDPFYPFIETIFHKRVTAGGGCGAGKFCGEDPVLRQQIAVFLLKGIFGADFVPAAATGTVFNDVSTSNPFAPWIEELARIGIVAGCAAPPPPALPSYCPAAPVNRQQMSVFLLKTRFGPNVPIGTCAGLFDDVPCSNLFAPYIEELVSLEVTAGCQVSPPLYCPTDLTRRKQMAAFLVKTFGLELYGPD